MRRWKQRDEQSRPLFADARGRSATSVTALASVAGSLPSRREMLLAFLEERAGYGANQWEAAEALNWLIQSTTPMFHELEAEKLIRRRGDKRPTGTGRQAFVYVLATSPATAVASGDLIPRTLPTRPLRRDLWRETEAAMAKRRREAAAEAVILAGRRSKKSDAEIRMDLTSAGLEWPK